MIWNYYFFELLFHHKLILKKSIIFIIPHKLSSYWQLNLYLELILECNDLLFEKFFIRFTQRIKIFISLSFWSRKVNAKLFVYSICFKDSIFPREKHLSWIYFFHFSIHCSLLEMYVSKTDLICCQLRSQIQLHLLKMHSWKLFIFIFWHDP
jgi:hypothetical protein